MNKTGKVLRVPGDNPGLVSLEGQQHSFTLETHWRSDDPPAIGMVVDAVLAVDGHLLTLKRQDLRQVASDQAKKTLDTMKTNGLPIARQLIDAVGPWQLGAVVLLYASWHWLDFLNLKMMGQGTGLTLVQLLPALKGNSMEAMLSMANGSGGFSGFLLWVALLAPLAIPLLKHRHAPLLALAPLAFLLYLYIALQVLISRAMDSVKGMGGMFGDKYAQQMMDQVSNAFSFGAGAYLSVLVSVGLAVLTVLRWRQLQRQPL